MMAFRSATHTIKNGAAKDTKKTSEALRTSEVLVPMIFPEDLI